MFNNKAVTKMFIDGIDEIPDPSTYSRLLSSFIGLLTKNGIEYTIQSPTPNKTKGQMFKDNMDTSIRELFGR